MTRWLKRYASYLWMAIAAIGCTLAYLIGARRPSPAVSNGQISRDAVGRAKAEGVAEVHEAEADAAEREAVAAEANATPQPTAADRPLEGTNDEKARIATDRLRGI